MFNNDSLVNMELHIRLALNFHRHLWLVRIFSFDNRKSNIGEIPYNLSLYVNLKEVKRTDGTTSVIVKIK